MTEWLKNYTRRYNTIKFNSRSLNFKSITYFTNTLVLHIAKNCNYKTVKINYYCVVIAVRDRNLQTLNSLCCDWTITIWISKKTRQITDIDSCKQVLFTFELAPASFLEQIPQYALYLNSWCLGCMRPKDFWGAFEDMHPFAIIKAYIHNRTSARRSRMGKRGNTTHHWKD